MPIASQRLKDASASAASTRAAELGPDFAAYQRPALITPKTILSAAERKDGLNLSTHAGRGLRHRLMPSISFSRFV